MMQLTDTEIRAALIQHLQSRPITPKAVLEEIRIHNGNAIADVVAINKTAHCYEIKGETDTVSRIVRQGSFYDRAFQRITLVTTNNHIAHAEKIAPPHWGIMLAVNAPTIGVRLSHLRRARENPQFDRQAALLTLWRSELVDIYADEYRESLSKLSRVGLAELISQKLGARDISKTIASALLTRQLSKGWSVTI